MYADFKDTIGCNQKLYIESSVSNCTQWAIYQLYHEYVFFVLDQYAYLDRKWKTNDNLFVNQRRTVKQ